MILCQPCHATRHYLFLNRCWLKSMCDAFRHKLKVGVTKVVLLVVNLVSMFRRNKYSGVSNKYNSNAYVLRKTPLSPLRTNSRYCPSYTISNSKGNHRTFAQAKAIKRQKVITYYTPGKVSISMSYIFHKPNNSIPWYIPPNFDQRRFVPGKALTNQTEEFLSWGTSLVCLIMIREKLHIWEGWWA